MLDALAHPGDRLLRAGQPEVMQFDLVAEPPRLLEEADVGPAAQGAFQRERLTTGAGKTTFAREFLPKEVKCLRFLNADEIARGLSPLKPSAGAVRAARLLLTEVDQCLRRGETFALES